MKNIKSSKEFKSLKDKIGMVKEDVTIMGSDFIVRPSINIPGSLVSAYMKKVKDETGEKLEDRFGKNQIAELLVSYLAESFLSIENFPTSIVTGTASTQVQPQTQVQTQLQPAQPQTQVQDGDAQNIQAQATAQDIPQDETTQLQSAQTQTQTQTTQDTQLQNTQTQTI